MVRLPPPGAPTAASGRCCWWLSSQGQRRVSSVLRPHGACYWLERLSSRGGQATGGCCALLVRAGAGAGGWTVQKARGPLCPPRSAPLRYVSRAVPAQGPTRAHTTQRGSCRSRYHPPAANQHTAATSHRGATAGAPKRAETAARRVPHGGTWAPSRALRRPSTVSGCYDPVVARGGAVRLEGLGGWQRGAEMR